MNRILTDLESGIAQFGEIWPDHDLGRWMLAIAEEAGEVIGAFNKWHSGYRTTPKTREDVLEEMCQLIACLLTTGDRLGVPPAEMLDMTGDFFLRKTRQIRKIREENL